MERDEKRESRRQKYQTSIQWAYFNTNHFYPARNLTFSGSGISFDSDVCPHPKANIFIKVEDLAPNLLNRDLPEGFRTAALAEVKWRRKRIDGDKICFEVGVKYH